MKRIIKTFTLLLILTICSNKGFGQTQGKTILNITTYEVNNKNDSKIIVTDNEKKIEEIDLLPFWPDYFESNQITINKALHKYEAMGYKIVSELRGAVAAIMVTTYRLEK